MIYNTPTLTLVGGAQDLVLNLSTTKTFGRECVNLDIIGFQYAVDEDGW